MILAAQQYRDRIEAGQVLARHLAHYASRVDALVLGLAPGGLAIGAEVASYLNAPLDAFIVRKLMLPDLPDVTIGAVTSGDVCVLDEAAIADAGLSRGELASLAGHETLELKLSEHLYRGNRSPAQIADRVIIVVDDGLASGFSMHAAVIALHRQQPAWLVVATPVGSPEACDDLAHEVHEVVCPLRPEPFQAVGLSYDHFPPIDDEQARACLRRAGSLPAS
jgi:putative phosphoribosyl transferase